MQILDIRTFYRIRIQIQIFGSDIGFEYNMSDILRILDIRLSSQIYLTNSCVHFVDFLQKENNNTQIVS
jgi:hypothetical protein